MCLMGIHTIIHIRAGTFHVYTADGTALLFTVIERADTNSDLVKYS